MKLLVAIVMCVLGVFLIIVGEEFIIGNIWLASAIILVWMPKER